MKKGQRRNEWTTEQVAYLIENAGRVPKRDLCARLKKSGKAVERMAARLRAQGQPVELRYFESRLTFCPACGSMRATAAEKGICEPCRRREQLETIQARISELWPFLTQAQRDKYEETEAETESRHDPMPKAPEIPADASYYRRQRIREDWAIDCELTLAANLMREVKAAQKRKERIEKKVKTNGGLHVPPGQTKEI